MQPESEPQAHKPRRRRWLVVAVILLVLFGLDVSRAPEKQWSARLLLGSIDLYQETLSPLMPAMGVQCKFTPTCSHYGEASIRQHGTLVGTAKAAWRVLRCGPWTRDGTVDPP